MLIRAKAPLRLGFAGGGTDVPPYPDFEGGCVLSATVNLYSFGTLCPRADDAIHLRSADFNLALEYGRGAALAYDGQLDLAKAAIRKLGGEQAGGFDLYLHTDARPGSGLGSSSSLMVTVIGLMKEWLRLTLDEAATAEMAWKLERQELGIPGGMQDQYAASFGGWNFIEFGQRQQVLVNPLRLPADVRNELEHNLVLCFTGATRISDNIVADQTARFQRGDHISLDSLRRQKQLATEMKNLLLSRRLDEFGALMHEAWEYKKRMSPQITNARIDALYKAARQAGALGGKLNGAGGGGYMMFYCDFERRLEVEAVLRERGCVIRDFAFEDRGLQTWRAATASAAALSDPAPLLARGA
jgi:D-glycero-alpha-D-manno-heptose-7-phosphate kinase